jgi:hypothetical protein
MTYHLSTKTVYIPNDITRYANTSNCYILVKKLEQKLLNEIDEMNKTLDNRLLGIENKINDNYIELDSEKDYDENYHDKLSDWENIDVEPWELIQG